MNYLNWEAHSLLRDPIWLRSSQTWNPSHITWANDDKSMYFVWHHCFHVLLNENIDNTTKGVEGCCGKQYSQDFVSFLNDAGERKVFTAVLSQWNECPGRPKVYSPCISPATYLFSHYICSWKDNVQRTFRTEAAVDKKPASNETGLFPSEVEEKTQLHQWIISYWEAGRLLWDPYWLRSSDSWNPSHITWANADKSMYFVWHHCFHLLLNENIDIISNGVDGCYGKHYSQDFISFPNDAVERKVFTAVLSDWNECPGMPKVYSPCISGYIIILPLHLLLKREHSEDVSHWGSCG